MPEQNLRDAPLFDPVNFAKLVDAAIYRQRITQQEAAKAIGVSRSTLWRMLAGKEPSVETYLRVKRWIERPLARQALETPHAG